MGWGFVQSIVHIYWIFLIDDVNWVLVSSCIDDIERISIQCDWGFYSGYLNVSERWMDARGERRIAQTFQEWDPTLV
jgi:hypothetical protein